MPNKGCFGLFIAFLLFASPAQSSPVLTWDDCLREAGKNNPDLVVAFENVNQLKAVKVITQSGRFPQLDAEAAAGRSNTKFPSQSSTTTKSYSYGVAGSLLLFDGFKSANDVNAAVENVLSAEESYRFSSADVRLQLRTAFINLLRAQHSLLVSQEILHIRENSLKLINLRYEAGLEHKGSLLKTQASLLEAKTDLTQAVRALDLAQRELSRVMGIQEFQPFEVTDGFEVVESAHEMPAFDALAGNHPSVREAVHQKNSADFSLRSARGEYLPQVFLQAGGRKSGTRWAPENRGLDAELVVSLPLFEGGRRKGEIDQAQSVLRQTDARLRSTQNSVLQALRQSWENYREALEAVEVAKSLLDANTERAKIAEAQYSTGFISYDNWTIIEDNLVQSKKGYLNAEANALLAEAEWINSKGETLEYARK